MKWEEYRAKMNRLAKVSGEYAGIPMVPEGVQLTVHPSYKFAAIFNNDHGEGLHVCTEEDVNEQQDWEIRNEYYSLIYKSTVTIIRHGKKYKRVFGRRTTHTGELLSTMGASRMWDLATEQRAQETLRQHVTDTQWNYYQLTGMFLETSRRSQVVYLFRRLFPTVALTMRGEEPRTLCTLCGHPIGFVRGSWAGAMCPTDDVIAALLLMRSDEKFLWRTYNQHPAWSPLSGL